MDFLDISNMQRRKPRRSMLGTHRGYSIGFQLNDEPIPQTNDTDVNTNPVSTNIANMGRRPPRKSMLGTRRRESSIFSLLPDTSFNTSTNPRVEAIKNVEEANDSFEEHETFMMTDESEESVLASTLIDDTIVEMTGADHPKENETTIRSESDKTILDVTVTKADNEDSVLMDTISNLNLIIESNTRSVNRYNKQIDEWKKEIDEKNRQTEDLIELKCRLMKKFNLSESPTEATAKSPAIKSPELRSKARKCKAIAADQKENIESPSTAVPSKQIIRELRSTIKFLKTPRRSTRRSRASTILTPHSMSFSIKSQLEKLME